MEKILLSAYCCIPGAGSEYDIGWNWAQSIAATGRDVTVITRAFDERRIKAAPRKEHQLAITFVFHELPSFVYRILYKLPLGNYLYCLMWQYTAARKAAALHRRKNFDQVQHITWGSLRVPSFMGRLGIPFIFGPIGGGEDTPRRLRRGLGWRGRLSDAVRRLSNRLLLFDPIMRSTYGAANEILVTTDETLIRIPRAYRSKVRVQPAAGIDPSTMRQNSPSNCCRPGKKKNGRLEILYTGRLLPWKGLHLALLALAKLGDIRSGIHMTIIGTGPDEHRLKRLGGALGVSDCVSWLPWMERNALLRMFPDFDLFLFPSLHDSGGMAILEALACGVPVVCLDRGGPSLFVNESCGRVISTASDDENKVAERIATFIWEFARNRDLLTPLSAGARERANTFTWDAHVNTVYGKVPCSSEMQR